MTIKMRRQNVIVFSSGKNKRVAHEIAQGLDCGVCRAVVWGEFFGKIYGDEYTLTKSYALFPFLVKKIPPFDYAIIVAGDDDRMRKNDVDGQELVTARDNVIFELGFCAMALGDKRVIIVHHEDVRLIDDLRGTGEETSQKTAQKVLDIKADDAIEKDRLSRLLAKEIDLFRNTLAQFLLPSKDGAYHVTASDAEAGSNQIFIAEVSFGMLNEGNNRP